MRRPALVFFVSSATAGVALSCVALSCSSAYTTNSTPDASSDADAKGASDDGAMSSDAIDMTTDDATASDGSSTAANDAAGDAAPLGDAAFTCVDASAAPTKATAFAAHALVPPAIDGKLDDWPCAAFYLLSSATGTTSGATPDVGRFAVEWDDNGIYFAMSVDDSTVGGAFPDPFRNDAAELFLAGEAPDGAYNADDLHLVVDYKNLAARYAGLGTASAPPTGFVSAAVHTSTGYNVEMFIPKSALGLATMTAMTLPFDAQIDDNAGTAQTGIVWFTNQGGNGVPDDGVCNAAPRIEPSCNTYDFGKLTLMP